MAVKLFSKWPPSKKFNLQDVLFAFDRHYVRILIRCSTIVRSNRTIRCRIIAIMHFNITSVHHLDYSENCVFLQLVLSLFNYFSL